MLRIRIPAHVPFESVVVTGPSVYEWSSDHRWLSLNLLGDQSGTIQWLVPEWSTSEIAGPLNHMGLWPGIPRDERLTCILDYRGNELVRITPSSLRLSYISGL